MTSEHHRPDDPPLTITRAVPLTWLLGLVGAILVWAASQYYGQQSLAEKVVLLTVRVEQLSIAIAAGSAKVAEHEFRLTDHERRLQALERKP